MLLTHTLGSCSPREQKLPVAVDRRTPGSAFDTFKRAALKGQREALWESLHPELRRKLQLQALREGELAFFRRLENLFVNEHGPLTIGDPVPAGELAMCPLFRSTQRVGTATFRFQDRSWYLFSLS
ncbi:MAG: hypothetical protein AB1758_22345 [Candidatus Eremiobacterota bacterium]